MKTKLNLTLSEQASELLELAPGIEGPCKPLEGEGPRQKRFYRNFILGWAIRSVCAALVKASELKVPFSVELKPEKGALGGATGPRGPRSRWRFGPESQN